MCIYKLLNNLGVFVPFCTFSLFIRSHDCDIRIQLPNVSKEHARIDVDTGGEVSMKPIIPK